MEPWTDIATALSTDLVTDLEMVPMMDHLMVFGKELKLVSELLMAIETELATDIATAFAMELWTSLLMAWEKELATDIATALAMELWTSLLMVWEKELATDIATAFEEELAARA